MALTFDTFFERYETIVKSVDDAFAQIEKEHGELVKCGQGCSDCCHALFDLTLVEAAYLNHHFNKVYQGMERSEILEHADEADREAYRIKRRMFKATEEGAPASEILKQVAEARVRCPLLDDKDMCVLYDHRPITCRLYGVPTAIGGETHTCGLSGFEPGKAYPTVRLERIQDALMALSVEMASSIGTKYKDLGSMLVPVSMALMNDYDEEYLGVMQGQTVPAPAPAPSAACESCSEDKSACAACKDNTIVLGQGPDGDGEE